MTTITHTLATTITMGDLFAAMVQMGTVTVPTGEGRNIKFVPTTIGLEDGSGKGFIVTTQRGGQLYAKCDSKGGRIVTITKVK